MEKLKLILASLFTALCWTSLCFDWDLLMYISGMIALIVIWTLESKENKQDIFSKEVDKNSGKREK